MTTIYELDRLNTVKPTLTISIFDAAIDWGYKEDEANQPEQVPYYCELTAIWQGNTIGSYIAVSTHGLIYAKANEANATKFKRWNTSRFEIDYQTNWDTYDLKNKQDNTQEFEFDCLIAYDNYEAISQAAADKLEAIARDLGNHTVNIEYPNGMIELIGLEP